MDPASFRNFKQDVAITASPGPRNPKAGHSSGGRDQTDIIDLTNDSDDGLVSDTEISEDTINAESDEDLKRAIELSLQTPSGLSPHPQESRILEASKNQGAQSLPEGRSSDFVAPGKTFGIPGLDRKKQEQERLARVAKRKLEGSISPPIISKGRKIMASGPKNRVHDTGLRASSLKPPTPRLNIQGAGETELTHKVPTYVTPSPTPSIQFPRGTVKKTWAFRQPRTRDDIKIEEVLQGPGLQLAILSSFQWNMNWLFSKLDTSRTRILLVVQAKDESTYESDIATIHNLRLCFPPMDEQVNCMHSKLMLLFHPEYLRIAVPSANLVPHEWGEIGIMENTIFLIDLPKMQGALSNKPKTRFYEDLVYFLKAGTLHENVIAKLSGFDFSETSRFAFIHSIGGSHGGETWRRTGYCGLGRAISALGLQTSKPINIDFVASSLGSLTNEFLRSLYLACQGDDGSIEFALQTAKASHTRSKNDPVPSASQNASEEWKDRFRVYFPSENTVNQSRGGPDGAGTICFTKRWYEGWRFPRHVLYDCISRRDGLLMHNKMLFARLEEAIILSGGSTCRAWCYVGSANLSESAWGRLVQDRSTKGPQLNCRNWECGVLVPIIHNPSERDKDIDACHSSPLNTVGGDHHIHEREKGGPTETNIDIARIFGGVVPVPMQVPGRPYAPDLKPWYYMET